MENNNKVLKRCKKNCNLNMNNNNYVDGCDLNYYKYLLYNNLACYNSIPNKYYYFLNDYKINNIDNNTFPIIIIDTNCTGNSNERCLRPLENIFSLISPKLLIKYNSPVILFMYPIKVILRIRFSNSKIKEIYNNKGEEISIIHIELCEDFLKKNNNINEFQPLIIYDIYDLMNDQYVYKIFSINENELSINDCNDCSNCFYKRCKTNYYLSNITNDCIECPIQCSQCSYESVQQNSCIKCNNKKKYYEIYDLNYTPYLKCVNETNKPNNLLLNLIQLRYEPCYETCEECFFFGNNKFHNCKTCINGYIKKAEKPNNCVLDCPEYYYYNIFGQYRCNECTICPDQMFLNKDEKKCVNECNNPYLYEFRGNCLKECPENTILDEYNKKCICNKTCTLMQEKIEINDLFDEKIECIDKIVKRYLFESQNNCPNDLYNYLNIKYNFVIYKDQECLDSYIEQQNINITKIDLKTCYEKLKQYYSNITIILIDIYRSRRPPYNYYNFYNASGDLLNITVCSNIIVEKKIDLLSLDMKNIEEKKYLLSQKINIFNYSSPFFQDLCYNFDSPNGKDITLNQRAISFYENITLCDTGCKNNGIDYDNYQALCECPFSNNLDYDLINEFIGEEIIDIIKETNIEVLKCYKDVFKFDHFKTNYGSMIILGLICFQIIFNIVYYYKDSIVMKRFITALFYIFVYFNDKNYTIKKNKTKIKKPINIRINKYSDKNINNNNNDNNNNIIYNKKEESKITIKNTETDLKYTSTSKVFINFSDYLDIKENQNRNNDNNERININNKLIKYRFLKEEIEHYIEKSPDEMDYLEAIDNDNRNFIDMYKDNLLDNHFLLNSLFEVDKCKPRSLKMIIYILRIDLYFVVNGLFYSESYIDELYNINKEEEHFFSFIPRNIEKMAYTSVISIILDYIVGFFITNKDIIKKIVFRNQGIKSVLKDEISKTLNKHRKGINGFIIINFLIMIFSWYFVSCFNNVYPNTKIEWIKSSIFIYLINEIISIFYIFGYTLLRFISIKFRIERCFYLINK